MSARIVVTIVMDEAGHVTIDAHGPIRMPGGLAALLEEARKLAEQAGPDTAARYRREDDTG